MKILTKILAGFAVAALILAGSIIITANKVTDNLKLSNTVTEVRVPTVVASMTVLNGINHSLAALRGWIILGKQNFVDERARAWENIDGAISEMNRKSENWTNVENKTRLKEMVGLLADFKKYQAEIEDIANTIDQRPDLKMLLEEAAPVASVMSTEITKMIDQELTEDASFSRKQLLGMMADVRGSLGLGLANIRAYLLSGDENFKSSYERFWKKNSKRFADLEGSRGLLRSEQKIAFDKFSAARKTFAPLPPSMFEIRGGNQFDIANYWLGTKAAPTAFKIKGILADMVENQKELLATDAKKAESMLSSLLNMQWILLGVGLVLCGIVGAYLGRAISRPVNKVVKLTEQMNEEFIQLTDVIEAIASNDLTREVRETEIESIGIHSKDEIGALVNSIEGTLDAKVKISKSLSKMTTNLTAMIRQIKGNACELVSAATEIASSSEQMARGAKSQTDQVVQVSTAVEEMTATIVEASRNTGQANDSAKLASETAESGGQIVGETIEGMQRINGVVRESSESIGKLANSANEIGEIVSVIDEIADQTNLLALNAAIEAARAGEQGRGFAVVADEVRKLAERTGKATGQITGMIKGIQAETEDAVQSMQSGIQEVDKGRELADKAGNSLNEIVTMSQSVMDMIEQIASSSAEQSTAAEQISRNIESVSSVVKETAIGAEQSATAAEELSRQAEGMQAMVSQFKIEQGVDA